MSEARHRFHFVYNLKKQNKTNIHVRTRGPSSLGQDKNKLLQSNKTLVCRPDETCFSEVYLSNEGKHSTVLVTNRHNLSCRRSPASRVSKHLLCCRKIVSRNVCPLNCILLNMLQSSCDFPVLQQCCNTRKLHETLHQVRRFPRLNRQAFGHIKLNQIS